MHPLLPVLHLLHLGLNVEHFHAVLGPCGKNHLVEAIPGKRIRTWIRHKVGLIHALA